jgi:hypothetical protein
MPLGLTSIYKMLQFTIDKGAVGHGGTVGLEGQMLLGPADGGSGAKPRSIGLW